MNLFDRIRRVAKWSFSGLVFACGGMLLADAEEVIEKMSLDVILYEEFILEEPEALSTLRSALLEKGITQEKEMTEERMRALVQKHIDMETKVDVEGTLETLVDHPVYEFYPLGLKLVGKDNIRQFYREHFDTFFPKLQSSEQINAWWGPHSACLEYDLYFKPPLDPKRAYRIVIVLTEKDGLLLGERFFAEEELVRLMSGKMFNHLVKFS